MTAVHRVTGGAQHYLALLARWLDAARPGDLLMSHPALAARAPDPIGAARCNEYQILSGDAFGEMLEHARILLAPMSRIASGA